MLEQVFASIVNCNSMSKLDAALVYAKVARVFPLRPNTKLPLLQGSWVTYATQDEKLIRQWWTTYPDANIAWAMGEPLLASDLDMKKGEDGWNSYQELSPGDITAPIQTTPRGGYHLIHKLEDGLVNLTKKGVTGGIDLRTTNGYIVVAPSSTPEGDYQWLQNGTFEKLGPTVSAAYTQWSNEVTVDRDVDMPDPTPYDDLKPLEDTTIRGKHLSFLQKIGRA